MARRNTSKPSRESQAIVKAANVARKSAEKDARYYRDQAKKILKNANLDRREFQKQVSKLKASGITSAKLDVRKVRPTRYRVRQLHTFADVIRGEAKALRVPKRIRDQYTEDSDIFEHGPFEMRGPIIVAPKEYTTDFLALKNDLLTTVRPLPRGRSFEQVHLPVKAANVERAIDMLLAERRHNQKHKTTGESYGFSVYGSKALQGLGYGDLEDLATDVKQYYKHILKRSDKHAFELFRFKGERMPDVYPSGERATIRGQYTPTGRRDGPVDQRKLERQALKKAKRRAKETPEELERRREYQREYKRRQTALKKGATTFEA